MSTPDPAAFADLLAGYCLEVQPGQQVLVRTTSLAAPLLVELQRAILERDAWPLLRVEVPGMQEGFFAHARDRHLDDVGPIELHEARKADCVLGIQAPDDVRALADVDPALLTRRRRGRADVQAFTMKKRWASTLWPTPALARQAGMSEEGFGDFVSRALFLDRPAGPVAAWGELRAFQADLIQRLAKARRIRIQSEGTDLELDVSGRTWVNSDGRRNMPSGEVFTSPREDSATGHITFDVPSGPAGVAVRGIRLELREGLVVDASAEEGEAYLLQALETDPGARRLGELGIGTNFGMDRPIGTILFDEKLGGTVHLAVGRSYPEAGGKNVSSLHWDMICDLRPGGSITADGVPIQVDGRFV